MITDKEELDFKNFFNKLKNKIDYQDGESISCEKLTNGTNHIFNYLKENNFNWNDIIIMSGAITNLALHTAQESLISKDQNTKILKHAIESEIEKVEKKSHILRDFMFLVSAYHGKPLTKIKVDMKRSNLISINLKERFNILEDHYFKCAYCGKSPPEVKLQLEHKIPRSKGGSDDISNLVPACVDCNLGKGNKLLK